MQDPPDIWGDNVMSSDDEHSNLSNQFHGRARKVLSSVADLEGTTLEKPTHLGISRSTNPKPVFPVQAFRAASAKNLFRTILMQQQVAAPVTPFGFHRQHGRLESTMTPIDHQVQAMSFKSNGFLSRPEPLNPFENPKPRPKMVAPVKSLVAPHSGPGQSLLQTPSIDEARSSLGRFDLLGQKASRKRQLFQDKGHRRCAPSELRASCRTLAAHSTSVLMGILAPDASRGIAALKTWTSDLELPKGKLFGMDVDGKPKAPPEGPVYIKYNSVQGNAYISAYSGSFRGVLFTPTLADGTFHQFGYLPLETPTSSCGNDIE